MIRSPHRRGLGALHTIGAAIALLACAHVALASGPVPFKSFGSPSISSRILASPAGENDGDQFGISIASVHDVNGDGYDDVLVGANFYPAEGGHGRAYLYFGGPGLDSVVDLVLPSPLAGIAWFGISVASAGDFNHDGYPDFIIGARYSGLAGQAFVYYGGPSLDAVPDLTLTGEPTSTGSWFGASVASAGDVNGDGIDDIVVGSPTYGPSSSQVGRAYVFYGGHTPDAVPDRVYTGVGNGDRLGWVVGSAGDMNGDGYDDIFATAPYNDSGGTDAGAVYVWFGGPTFHATPDLTIKGTGANSQLSYAACAGDVNGDGYSDLIISERDHAQVYFGGPTPDAIPDLTIPVSFASVSGVGDVNGDGFDDFAIGVAGDSTNGAGAGRVSIYFGGPDVDAIEDLYYLGDGYGRYFGQSVAAGGNVDGSGPADLIVAATDDPEHVGYNRGRVYIIGNSFGAASVSTPPLSGVTFLGAQPNPARNEVNFALTLDHAVRTRITVYDLAGHAVGQPVADEWLSGRVTRTWRPNALPSGIYYVRAQLCDRAQVRKLIWLGPR